MKIKEFFGVFKSGLKLTLKAKVLILISFLLIDGPGLLLLSLNPQESPLLSFVSFLWLFLLICFTYTLPKLLDNVNQKQLLTKELFFDSLSNTSKRLLIPTLLFIPVVIMLFIAFITLTYLLKIDVEQAIAFFNSEPLSLGYIAIIFVINLLIVSLFNFSPMFFNIQKVGFYKSIIKSLIFSLNNYQLTIVIALIQLGLFLIGELLPKMNILEVLIGVFESILWIIIFATSLLYWQKKLDKH